MLKNYDKRVKKKREAWEIYKALRKDDCYKHSELYEKAYSKAKQILIQFYKDYTFKYSKATNEEIEKCMNVLADTQMSKRKTIELTDKIINEFLKNI